MGDVPSYSFIACAPCVPWVSKAQANGLAPGLHIEQNDVSVPVVTYEEVCIMFTTTQAVHYTRLSLFRLNWGCFRGSYAVT